MFNLRVIEILRIKIIKCVLFGFLLFSTAHAETWRFVAIGDIPYSAYERSEFPAMLESIAAESADFIIHAGDFKRGNTPCGDDILRDRLQLFNTSKVPFIFVPGDNDWTDCKRLAAGHFDEIERLGKLRQLFFGAPYSLGQKKIPVEQQSVSFPEHLRWHLGPVLFISLNVPGPNNNAGMGQDASLEFLGRNPFVLDWIRQGFSLARREKSAGIVVVMQGNPGFKHFAAGYAHLGYRELLDTLRRETLNFPGQVLLVHGDTHWQRIDHPLLYSETSEPIVNFTRIETFGYPFMGWVTVIIDNKSSALFRFEVRGYKPD